MGPNLRGVIGRKGGVNPGFGYSGSLQSAAVVWTESVLDTFIESPRKVISNTTMTFMGEPDAQRRAEIINYLKSLQ
jgi:cytochrome c